MPIVNFDAVNVKQCIVLGGCGYVFPEGDVVDLEFGHDAFVIQSGDSTIEHISYLEVVEINIDGPGRVTSGGGFIGGGFGVAGAIEGMAVATILNRLMSRTKIHTFITLVTHMGELHLHYGDMEPGALRIALSWVFSTLRKFDPKWIHTQLERLEEMHTQKALSDSEFERLKQRLVARPLRADLSARMGKCPSCEEKIPLLSQECPKCKAYFSHGAAWQVKPL